MPKKYLLIIPFSFICLLSYGKISAQTIADDFPVRGFSIASPPSYFVDSFVTFINTDLAAMNVNTLILRVDYNYQFTSHPELRDNDALSYADVKKIVTACRTSHIRIIPQINLLGHQSWASTTMNLLRIYPQFDETPNIVMPAVYKWPNDDTLYCKSYCPLHPDLHSIVFSLIDEICDVFEADAFHAGMDEVFYIGDRNCPRCKNISKAKLFADEVTRIHDHLAKSNKELWIWGDRLLDAARTGLGIWEASGNNTHTAIDIIPKDVVICDWHYDTPSKTPQYFASKGFKVATCTWNKPEVALAQLKDVKSFRDHTSKSTQERYLGIIQTVWSGAPGFIREYYHLPVDSLQGDGSSAETFRQLFTAMKQQSR